MHLEHSQVGHSAIQDRNFVIRRLITRFAKVFFQKKNNGNIFSIFHLGNFHRKFMVLNLYNKYSLLALIFFIFQGLKFPKLSSR